jgi:protein-S-isoprenylcysteine O-methyltransferase Ste14
MRTRIGRRAGRGYFALQATAGATWWAAVFTVDSVRTATLGGLDPVLVAALDLPLFVAASALAAFGLRWAVWTATGWTILVTACMVVYATVTQLAGWGAVFMLAATAGSAAAALLVLLGRIPGEQLLIGPFAFRTARTAGTAGHLAKTGVGLMLLAAASALGVWSAVSMSSRGQGTPLPSAMPARLVIAGPYRFVRNPMAVAGIAQGVAVGLVLGSWLVVLYALAGSLVWNWVIRPLEEQDLEHRFGDEFRTYRRRVACWVTRVRRPR